MTSGDSTIKYRGWRNTSVVISLGIVALGFAVYNNEKARANGKKYVISTYDWLMSFRKSEEQQQAILKEKRSDKDDDEHKEVTKHPWETKVCVLTFGCSHNSSDAEYMKGVLNEEGFILVDDKDSADIVVVNSCTVKNPSQDSAMNLVKSCSENGQKVIVGGCVPQADPGLKWLKDVSLVGVDQLAKLPDIVYGAMNGQRTVLLKPMKDRPSLMLPKIRKNRLIEIIPINQGCLGRCTYCKTRYARGTLSSYSSEDIIERMKSAVLNGVTQIWITSEDTGAYGLDFDHKYVLHDLLKSMCDVLDKMPEANYGENNKSISKVMIRVGMTNPPYILNQLTELAALFDTRKQLFRFLHIPVQSGSDNVLQKMIRDYTVADYISCVNGFRSKIFDPPMKFSTDFICAFPHETDEDHQITKELIRTMKIDAVNISQYYARPGTAAAKMVQIDRKIAKTRTRETAEVFEEYRTFEYLREKEILVWFSELSDRSHHVVGHSKSYVKVLVDHMEESCIKALLEVGIDMNSISTEEEQREVLLGMCAVVLIDETAKWNVFGKIQRIVQ